MFRSATRIMLWSSLLLLLCVQQANCQDTKCPIALEECNGGQCNKIIQKTKPDLEPPYLWTVRYSGSKSAVVVSCEKDGCITDPNSQGVEATVSLSGDLHTLKFNNVSRQPWDMEGTWAITKDNVEVPGSKCRVCLYANEKSHIKCEQPMLTEGNTHVSVTCAANPVYPKSATFKLLASTGDISTSGIQDSPDSETHHGYFKYQWTRTMDLAMFQPGERISFQMEIEPATCGSPGKRTIEAGDIELELPTATLPNGGCPDESKNATKGYIKEGTTATCTCALSVPGVPSGKAVWYKNGELYQETPLLTLTSEDASDKFTCFGESVIGKQEQGIHFKPKVARKPNAVTINHHGRHCNERVIISCITTKRSSEPDIIMELKVILPGSAKPEIKSKRLTETGEVQFRTHFETTVKGSHNVSCVAKSSLFQDLVTESEVLQLIVHDESDSIPSYTSQQASNQQNGKANQKKEPIYVCFGAVKKKEDSSTGLWPLFAVVALLVVVPLIVVAIFVLKRREMIKQVGYKEAIRRSLPCERFHTVIIDNSALYGKSSDFQGHKNGVQSEKSPNTESQRASTVDHSTIDDIASNQNGVGALAKTESETKYKGHGQRNQAEMGNLLGKL